jgi:hypothetical protein
MIPVAGDGVSLDFEQIAARIRRSSNFRVAWQLFEWDRPCKATARTARQVLETIVLVPELQAFLASSEPPLAKPPNVQRIHAHCVFKTAFGTFERSLARAASDRLGAYSRILADAPAEEIKGVEKLFLGLGPYVPFELLPGDVEGCAECRRHNGHLFSDWFYGVAWDWCYCVIWEDRSLVGLLCMTDTD